MKPELTESEIMALADKGLYIGSYNTLYFPRYSRNAGARLETVRTFKSEGLPMFSARGRFRTLNPETVNRLIGFELIWTPNA